MHVLELALQRAADSTAEAALGRSRVRGQLHLRAVVRRRLERHARRRHRAGGAVGSAPARARRRAVGFRHPPRRARTFHLGSAVRPRPGGDGQRVRPRQRSCWRLADQRRRRCVEWISADGVLGIPHLHVLRHGYARGDDQRQRRDQPRDIYQDPGTSALSAAPTAASSSFPPTSARSSVRRKSATPDRHATSSPVRASSRSTWGSSRR